MEEKTYRRFSLFYPVRTRGRRDATSAFREIRVQNVFDLSIKHDNLLELSGNLEVGILGDEVIDS